MIVSGYQLLSVILLATMIVGFLRILQGPTATDCILAVFFFGTTGIGILLLLSLASGDTRMIDVGLVLALLSAVVGATYVRLGWLANLGDQGADHE